MLAPRFTPTRWSTEGIGTLWEAMDGGTVGSNVLSSDFVALTCSKPFAAMPGPEGD